jgi:4'-phosphopantetheinyl transferase
MGDNGVIFPVDLWTVSLAHPGPTHLSEDEVARANRFRFEVDRIRWSRARSALRLVLSRYAGEDPDALFFAYGKQGKPSLGPVTGIEFNLSHSGDWAMIAVTREIPVGVDIERIRPEVDIGQLLQRLEETDLPETVPELYHAWTRREAKTKAIGGALFDKPRGNVYVVNVAAPEGYAASVALVGCTPVIRYRTELPVGLSPAANVKDAGG